MCVSKSGTAQPTWSKNIIPSRTRGGALKGSWVGGEIGLTRPVLGRAITSLARANEICVESFGPGYRMGSHHDGDCPPNSGCGWGFWGSLVFMEDQKQMDLTKFHRFWMYIRD